MNQPDVIYQKTGSMNRPGEEPPVHRLEEPLLGTNEPSTSKPLLVTMNTQTFEKAKEALGLGFASPLAGALVLANTLMGGSG